MSLIFPHHHSRGACLKTLRMARFITPSPSSRFARTIDLPADDDDLRAVHDDDVIAKNRMVIRKYKSDSLTPSHVASWNIPGSIAPGSLAGYLSTDTDQLSWSKSTTSPQAF